MENARLALKILIGITAIYGIAMYMLTWFAFNKRKEKEEFSLFINNNQKFKIAFKISYFLFSFSVIGFIILFLINAFI